LNPYVVIEPASNPSSPGWRPAESVARPPLQVLDVDPGLVDQLLVVEEGDRVPDLRDAPVRAVARVEVDDRLLPLVVVLAEGLVDVEQRAVVDVQAEVRGVRPENVRHVARVDVERELRPVGVPRDDLDVHPDVRVLLGELGERRLVGGGGRLVPEAEGDDGGVLVRAGGARLARGRVVVTARGARRENERGGREERRRDEGDARVGTAGR
jgi:hypothetical protein